ncbi:MULTISPECIES: AMP-binding protein [unclassified Sphingobium]|uniref:AMP-binding protein n=1 Tax=unclassified Sphingobium TaxID=2611147 RepID=UPI002223EFF4|nr:MULTISPECIES: AMP-binding protein [unclassified Sphingobium]MCW2411867.1 acyl-CoA ligase (AMP-forming) (exosortase A-associated) [Sphingobium sp. B8D3D]MCW2415835.1 acyl-CoA ligase (AMP-forming) (exosortase A-associated) [Sphingobium sp. B8D3A]
MPPPLDHLTQQGEPTAIALAGKFGAIDYATMEHLVGRLAHLLAARLDGAGAPAGSRVAAWLPKGLLAALLPLAVVRAGHVYVPINPLLKRAQVAHIVRDSGAGMLISQPARLGTLEPGDLAEAVARVEEAALLAVIEDADAATLPPGTGRPGDLAEILYTSGSTGRPKGVMLSHANLMIGARSVAGYLGLDATDRTLALLPLSFDYGQNQLLSTWWAGGCVVPLDYLLPREVAKVAARHAITTLAGVPPLWVQLTEIDWPPEARAALRRLTNSGGALTRPLIARLRETFPGVDVFAMYGLTEAFRSTYLPPDLLDRHPDSIGQAIPDAEVLVVRADGTLTDDDEPGELVHSGPLVAQGYWHDAARTAERFRPAPAASAYGGMAVWSGDTVVRDGAGLLRFVGRDDAMIKSAGIRISPSEVEEAAVAVAGVAEACALGRADERLGQAIVLFVRAEAALCETDRDSLGDRLAAQLRQTLPNFMQPAEIRILAQMPRNPNGKIDRVALAALAGEGGA